MARIIQAILDAMAILPLFYILRSLTRSRWLALPGCLLYASAPWWGAGATYLLGESLLPPLVICVLAAMIWLRGRASSLRRWAALGLFSAALPLFHADMMLLAIPLAIWALIVAPSSRRLVSAMTVVAAFVVPLLAWSAQNYMAHGTFTITVPVKWYSMWSGLGQLPNGFGYLASDVNAGKTLSLQRIRPYTPQAEEYWKTEYISALKEHPGYVLSTVFYRINIILTKVENYYPGLRGVEQLIYGWLLWLAPVAVAWLLWKRRWSDALIVAGPMVYAICSLGPMYVEPRYVRYAGLTYILAPPVVAALILESVAGSKGSDFSRPGLQGPSMAVGILCSAALAAYVGWNFPSLWHLSETAAVASLFDRESALKLPAHNILDSGDYSKQIPDLVLTKTPAGLKLAAYVDSSYLLTARLGDKAGAVVVHYKVNIEAGDVGIGVLSQDRLKWLTSRRVMGAPGTVVEDRFVSGAEPGSLLVVSGYNTVSKDVRFVLQALDWAAICPVAPVKPLYELFAPQKIAVKPCEQGS